MDGKVSSQALNCGRLRICPTRNAALLLVLSHPVISLQSTYLAALPTCDHVSLHSTN